MSQNEAIAVSGTRRSMKELVDGTIRVQIDIDPVYRELFFKLFGQIDMPVAIAPMVINSPILSPVHEEQRKPDKKEANYLAQSMHRDGYFRNPKLWDAMEEKGLYTQEMHKVYVQSLPCCGIKFAPHIKPCDGDVVMHHVKTSANSGVRIKPLHWYGVPLCCKHHMTWAHGSHKGSASHEDRHDVMLPHAVGLTADRIKAAFKDSLGLESLSEITQEMLDDFEKYLFGRVINNYAA
ncbi:hypothetical protein [Nitrosomonas sp.]|uniref:hypothetical protein n=1 Tax=Nitrosomonas sp. TaxID=42353 RepID=UPI0025DD95A7|nr:hypothetical protein [Nitrosomonas sp.]